MKIWKKSKQYNKKIIIVELYIYMEIYVKAEKNQHKRKPSMFLYTSAIY